MDARRMGFFSVCGFAAHDIKAFSRQLSAFSRNRKDFSYIGFAAHGGLKITLCAGASPLSLLRRQTRAAK